MKLFYNLLREFMRDSANEKLKENEHKSKGGFQLEKRIDYIKDKES